MPLCVEARALSSCCAALAQTVAANNLCNSFQAFNTNYHDTGLFGIITTADKNAAIDDLSWAIMHEVQWAPRCLDMCRVPAGSVRCVI